MSDDLETFVKHARMQMTEAARELFSEGAAMGLAPNEITIAIITGAIRAQAFFCLGSGIAPSEFDGLLAKTTDDLRAAYAARKAMANNCEGSA